MRYSCLIQSEYNLKLKFLVSINRYGKANILILLRRKLTAFVDIYRSSFIELYSGSSLIIFDYYYRYIAKITLIDQTCMKDSIKLNYFGKQMYLAFMCFFSAVFKNSFKKYLLLWSQPYLGVLAFQVYSTG
jgi:hypothetical protein